jgi:hypothetical protein
MEPISKAARGMMNVHGYSMFTLTFNQKAMVSVLALSVAMVRFPRTSRVLSL